MSNFGAQFHQNNKPLLGVFWYYVILLNSNVVKVTASQEDSQPAASSPEVFLENLPPNKTIEQVIGAIDNSFTISVVSHEVRPGGEENSPVGLKFSGLLIKLATEKDSTFLLQEGSYPFASSKVWKIPSI